MPTTQKLNSAKMTLSALVAVASNGVIGYQNQLPWHLPADLQYFKKLTTNHALLMGRKTYESIGRPLPNRLNLVWSRQTDWQAEGCIKVNDWQQACEIATEKGYQELFVIGGAEVYRQLLPSCQKLYLTEVKATPTGDATLHIDLSSWQEISRTSRAADEKNQYAMEFVVLQRK